MRIKSLHRMAVPHVGGWKPGDRNTFASDYSVCVPSSASVWSGSRSRRAGAPPSPARGRGRRPSRAVSRGPRGRAGSPPPARRRRRGRSGRGAIPVVRVEESVKERTCHGYTIHNAAILWLWHVTAWVIVTTKDRHRVPDLIGGTERYSLNSAARTSGCSRRSYRSRTHTMECPLQIEERRDTGVHGSLPGGERESESLRHPSSVSVWNQSACRRRYTCRKP